MVKPTDFLLLIVVR